MIEEILKNEDKVRENLTQIQQFGPYRFLRKYHRPQIYGTENLPEGRSVLIGNHSGTIPIDGPLFGAKLFEQTNRITYFMGHRKLKNIKAINKLGMTCGDRETAIEILSYNKSLFIFPEGEAGLFKSSRDRYQVPLKKGFSHGRCGYLIAALATKSPVIPVAIIGLEELFYNFGNVQDLVEEASSFLRLGVKTKRLPRIPFPLHFVPLPSAVTFLCSKPMNVIEDYPDFDYELFREQLIIEKEEETPQLKLIDMRDKIFDVNKKVHGRLQAMIDLALEQREGTTINSKILSPEIITNLE